MYFEYNNLNNVDIQTMHETHLVKTINKTEPSIQQNNVGETDHLMGRFPR